MQFTTHLVQEAELFVFCKFCRILHFKDLGNIYFTLDLKI